MSLIPSVRAKHSVLDNQFINQHLQWYIISHSEQSSADSAELPCYTTSKSYNSFYRSSSNSFILWHNRLGHPGSSIVKVVLTKCSVPNNDEMNTNFCETCLSCKDSRATFSLNKKWVSNTFAFDSHWHLGTITCA